MEGVNRLIVDNQLMKSKRKYPKGVSGWTSFDDCPICQAMKEGKASTGKELREAFRKAAEKNRGGFSV